MAAIQTMVPTGTMATMVPRNRCKLGTCSSLSRGGGGGFKSCPDGTNPVGGDGADASCPNSASYQDDGDYGAGVDGGLGGDGACDAEISRSNCGSAGHRSTCWGTGGDGDFGGDGDHGTGGSGRPVQGPVLPAVGCQKRIRRGPR